MLLLTVDGNCHIFHHYFDNKMRIKRQGNIHMEEWRMQLMRKSKTNHESLMVLDLRHEFSVIFLLTDI